MDKISIIIPCFNEEEALPIYYAEMKKVMDSMKKQTSFELLFVDDGSSDRTYEIMKDLHRKDGRCQYLSFSFRYLCSYPQQVFGIITTGERRME